ncbi:MAG: hypothetical protein A2W22_05405 [Candidatus Levybacteria bacterium RBG_16_35_11]|nr:MAG: hypothetical protein A2W22_05405 [Candidatus Levybacteria bacterium RBG_16_35_11]
MTEQPITPSITEITESLTRKIITVSEVNLNLSQGIIITTENKVRICLSDHLKRMEKKKGWLAPFGIFVTVIVVLLTSTFKDVGLDSATWHAIFIIAGLISFGWLLLSIREALQSEKVDDIVNELKKGAQIKTI